MSRFGADNEVRTVFTADASGTVAESQRAADAVEKSAERQRASVRGLRSAVESIRGTLASLGGAVAVGIGLAKIFDGFLNRADDVKQSLREIGEESRALLQQTAARRNDDNEVTASIRSAQRAAQSAIDAARQRAEQQAQSFRNILLRQLGYAPTQEEIDAEVRQAISNANESVKLAIAQNEKDAENARKREADKRVDDERKALEAVQRVRQELKDTATGGEGFAEINKLSRDYQDSLDAINEKYRNARSDEEKNVLQQRMQAESDVYTFRRENMQREVAEREKRIMESNERIAEQQRELSNRIAEEFGNSLTKAYSDSLAEQRRQLDTTLSSIAVSVSAIKDLIRLQSIAGQQPGEAYGVNYGDPF